MANNKDDLEAMRAFVGGVLRRDGVSLEAAGARASRRGTVPGEEAVSAPPGSESDTLEAIISNHRPVFAIVGDKVDPSATSSGLGEEETEAADLVGKSAASISRIVRSVGRIDLPGNINYPWIGTGWIVDSDLGKDIIVTNAHVAEHFAERSGEGFTFSMLPFKSTRETPLINFRHEKADTTARSFQLTDVIHIDDKIDVAFMRVSRQGVDAISSPIMLDPDKPEAELDVATLGYPGTDRGSYDIETLLRIFGNVFDTKRLSPGKLTGSDDLGLMHDCSTMPGSSGSVLFNLKSGKAVGLHFQGIPFTSNHAVPAADIARLMRDKPWSGSGRRPNDEGKRPPMGNRNFKVNAGGAGNAVRIVVPLEIAISLGTPVLDQPGDVKADAPDGASQNGPFAGVGSLNEAANAVKQAVAKRDDIVDIRATYLFKDGLLSDDKGVVVRVLPEAPQDPAALGLPSDINGMPVVVEVADLEAVARKLAGVADERFDLEAAAQAGSYERDISLAKFKLDPVEEEMRITLHASPEAGWRVLSKFFADGGFNRVTVGMYNFTAPLIINAVRDGLKQAGNTLKMTLDRVASDAIGAGVKKNDWPETKLLETLKSDAPDRFKWTPASVSGSGKLFATAYHIKVAVLSQGDNAKRFWLSSGNWASSNQAPFDDAKYPLADLTRAVVEKYDRDWHAVVVNKKLATLFRNHLEQDFDDSAAKAEVEAAEAQLPDLLVPEDYFEATKPKGYKPFSPLELNEVVKVTPILTPDNYPEIVTPLIASAKSRVLFINQSFDIKDDEANIPPHYLKLLKALLAQQRKGLDVRIIFRSGYGKEGDIMRRAAEFGFDKTKTRFYGTCHTKGIVVDNDKVLLGSQNWTGAGTKFNRDAALLVEHARANDYFAQLFEHDWDNFATNVVKPIHPKGSVKVVDPGQEAPTFGLGRRIPWRALEDS